MINGSEELDIERRCIALGKGCGDSVCHNGSLYFQYKLLGSGGFFFKFCCFCEILVIGRECSF